MLKVEYAGNGYKVSTGDHAPVIARNKGEILEAVAHYYGIESPALRYHSNGNGAGVCPMCRQVAARMKRERRTIPA